jgi:ADP-heptose:LPS heptosyltransferase
VSFGRTLLPPFDAGIRGLCRRLGRPRPGRGVLFVRSGGLGDTVLFSHVMPLYMRCAKAGEPVAVLTPARSLATAFLFPEGVEVIAVDYRRFLRDPVYRLRVSVGLYRRGFRRVVSTDHLRHPLADEAMMAACQAEECVAMLARRWPKHDRLLAANRRFFSRLYDSGAERGSVYLRWVAFANWLGGRADAPPPPLARPDRLPPPRESPRPYVVIQPFSADRRKQPPATLFLRIVDVAGRGRDVVVTGAADDPVRNPEYAPLLAKPGVRFDCSSFRDAVPLLRGARLVVSVDTALMHLAIAVGAPTLCLASAAFAGEIVPYPKELTPANAHFLYHPMPCEGCRAACHLPAEDGMYPCVARLDQAAVLAKIAAILEGDGDEGRG